MTYNDLIKNVKRLFLVRLQKLVSDEAYKANPLLSKDAYLEVVYTEIMSLGYNFGNVQNAANDIYEMESIIKGESEELKSEILRGVIETHKRYKKEIELFSEFHKSHQNGNLAEDMLQELEIKLNA